MEFILLPMTHSRLIHSLHVSFTREITAAAHYGWYTHFVLMDTCKMCECMEKVYVHKESVTRQEVTLHSVGMRGNLD